MQQKTTIPGAKVLDKTAMRALKGGGVKVYWTCMLNTFCFETKAACLANCPAATACRGYYGCV